MDHPPMSGFAVQRSKAQLLISSTQSHRMSMSDFHPSDVVVNWYGDGPKSDGQGPCDGCEHRDCDLFHTPFFGYWTGDEIDADVFLLGEAPGGNSNGGRGAKNASDERDHVDAVDEGWFDRTDERSLEAVANPSDNGFMLPQSFVSDLLSKGIHSYYTNVKKCNDIHTQAGKEAYEQARNRCVSYLHDELEAVDPSIVVVFSSETQGPEASHNIEYVFKQFGLHSEIEGMGKLESVIPDQNDPESMFPVYKSDMGFHVIPAFHFTRAGGHTGQRAEFEPDQIGRAEKSYSLTWKHRYYDELSDRIAELI
jgi:hypothetical protein